MAQTCYTPDGTADSDFTPCHASAQNSACCKPSDVCISNGYCWQQSSDNAAFNNRLARGLCTDRTWGSTSCPQFCKDLDADSTCSVVLALDQPSGKYCCGVGGDGIAFNSSTGQCLQSTQNSTDRPFGTEPFNLTEGQIIYNRDNGATLSSNAQVNHSLIASGACTPGQGGHGRNVVAIAAGIAVPLGTLLLAALVALSFLFAKSKKLERRLREQKQAAVGREVQGQQGQAQQPYWRSPYSQEAPDSSRYELGGGVPLNEVAGSEVPSSKVPDSTKFPAQP